VDLLIRIQKAAIRKLVQHRWLLYQCQKARFLLFRGPFRDTLVRFFQKRSNTRSIALQGPSIFPELDVEQTLRELDTAGYSEAFLLGPAHIESLFEFLSSTGSKHVYEVHGRCGSFDEIAYDPKVVAVARRYIGAEPILYASSLYLTGPDPKAKGIQAEKPETEDLVHFDANDFKDLNLFIYLNDVDQDTSPHFVIKRTHKEKSFRDLITLRYNRGEIDRRFPSGLETITGPAGFAFFEDTSCFHIQSVGAKGRYTASFCYTLQRSPKLARYSS